MANNNHKSKKKRWLLIGGAAVVLILVVLGVSGMLRSNHAIDPSKLAAVEKGDLARSVVATGKVEPLAKVEVKSKASGIVKQIMADYGDTVRTGQVLVVLDKEELAARVRESRASLQAAEAAHQASQASYERNKVEAEGPDVPFMKANLDRAQQLHKQGLIAQQVMEEADKNYQMALNRRMAAQRAVAVTREIGRASCRERV